MFGDCDSLRRLGVLLRGILIWGFSFRVGLSVPLSHQRGMSCWTLFLAYGTWLIFIILVFVLEIGIDSFFFVTDVLTFVFHSFSRLAFYFFLVFGLFDFI